MKKLQIKIRNITNLEFPCIGFAIMMMIMIINNDYDDEWLKLAGSRDQVCATLMFRCCVCEEKGKKINVQRERFTENMGSCSHNNNNKSGVHVL